MTKRQILENQAGIDGKPRISIDQALSQLNALMDEKEIETIISQQVNNWSVKPQGRCIPITNIAKAIKEYWDSR